MSFIYKGWSSAIQGGWRGTKQEQSLEWGFAGGLRYETDPNIFFDLKLVGQKAPNLFLGGPAVMVHVPPFPVLPSVDVGVGVQGTFGIQNRDWVFRSAGRVEVGQTFVGSLPVQLRVFLGGEAGFFLWSRQIDWVLFLGVNIYGGIPSNPIPETNEIPKMPQQPQLPSPPPPVLPPSPEELKRREIEGLYVRSETAEQKGDYDEVMQLEEQIFELDPSFSPDRYFFASLMSQYVEQKISRERRNIILSGSMKRLAQAGAFESLVKGMKHFLGSTKETLSPQTSQRNLNMLIVACDCFEFWGNEVGRGEPLLTRKAFLEFVGDRYFFQIPGEKKKTLLLGVSEGLALFLGLLEISPHSNDLARLAPDLFDDFDVSVEKVLK